MDQRRPLVVDCWESAPDPSAHGMPVDTKQAGNIYHGVVPMDFGEAGVRTAITHWSAQPRYLFGHALRSSPAIFRTVRQAVVFEGEILPRMVGKHSFLNQRQ